MHPGPHKQIQPLHRPPERLCLWLPPRSQPGRGSYILHRFVRPGLPSMLGGEKQEVCGGVPNAPLMLHLTWATREAPLSSSSLILAFGVGSPQGTGPHFTSSQRNVISSRAFQSCHPHSPTTPTFLLFSGCDVLFSHQHLLAGCTGTRLESAWLPASTQARGCIPASRTAPGTQHFAA